MSLEQIELAIPHRPPMRLIDSIVSQTHEKIVCTKTFHQDEFFVQGHFPGYPSFQASFNANAVCRPVLC